MKLPLILAILVFVIFGLVITTCLLFPPLKRHYYMGQLRSDNPKERIAGVDGLLGCGKRGVDALSTELGVDEKEIEFIAKHWANVGKPVERDEFNSYPLHLAASNDYKTAIECFLWKGASLDCTDSYGMKPIHNASRGGCLNAIIPLIKKGSDVNDNKNRERMTPLHLAAEEGHEDAVLFLLDKGADIDARTSGGSTSLTLACVFGYSKVAEMLIDKGADVNTKCNSGMTPLHCAAENDRKNIAELLIKKGAKVNLLDFHGKMPIDCSNANGCMKTTNLLRSHGARTAGELKYNVTDPLKSKEWKRADQLFRTGLELWKKSFEGMPNHLENLKASESNFKESMKMVQELYPSFPHNPKIDKRLQALSEKLFDIVKRKSLEIPEKE